MKTPVFKTAIILFTALISSQTHAQIAQVSSSSYEAKQKISVDLKITPSVEGFRAGVMRVDSSENKLRLWVTNSEEKRVAISVSSGNSNLWSTNVRDAYFNQVFDLSYLDDGEYLLKVECDKNRFERKILISTRNYSRRELQLQ